MKSTDKLIKSLLEADSSTYIEPVHDGGLDEDSDPSTLNTVKKALQSIADDSQRCLIGVIEAPHSDRMHDLDTVLDHGIVAKLNDVAITLRSMRKQLGK